MKNQNESLNAEINKIQSESKQMKSENDSLSESNRKLNEENDSLNKQIESLNEKFEELNSSNKQLAQEKDQVMKSLSETDQPKHENDVIIYEKENERKHEKCIPTFFWRRSGQFSQSWGHGPALIIRITLLRHTRLSAGRRFACHRYFHIHHLYDLYVFRLLSLSQHAT